MAISYYSTVLDYPADVVWRVVRDFNGLAVWFAPTVSESQIEDGRSGDSVGAVRCFMFGDSQIREHLLALSDIECSYSYEFCKPAPFPIEGYVATLKVTPVQATDQSFVEWWTEFDCAPDERSHWQTFFAAEVFAPALASLRDYLARC